jgi:hypothetical protein
MVRRRKRRVAPKSYYSLTEVKRKINNRQIVINLNAERDAFQLFGWGLYDIEDAYRRLQPKHFCKTVPAIFKVGAYLDYYKATIKGEKIFTHFYIDDETGLLVINSFHKQ